MSDPFSDPNASPWSRGGDPVAQPPPPPADPSQGWQQPPPPDQQGWGQQPPPPDQQGWGQPPPPSGPGGWGQQPQGWSPAGAPGHPPFGPPPGPQKSSSTILWIVLAVVVVLVLGVVGGAVALFSTARSTVDTVIQNLDVDTPANIPDGRRLLETTGSVGERGSERFEFAVPDRTTVQIDVIGVAGFDPIVTLYEGSSQIGRDDDGGAGLNSRLRLELSSGTYTAEVTGFAGDTGDFQIVITDR